MSMKVLARIPALDATAITIAGVADPPNDEPIAQPAATVRAPTAIDGRSHVRMRRPRSRFPAASVAALTILSAVAWSLASWSDAHRAERSRMERLARMQPVAAPETISR
jgi:hypothetical protein